MNEYDLTREERIRLEALAQANASVMGAHMDMNNIITRAKRYETYIKDGK